MPDERPRNARRTLLSWDTKHLHAAIGSWHAIAEPFSDSAPLYPSGVDAKSASKIWMRFSPVLVCVLLMSCSTNLAQSPSATTNAPNPAKVAESLKKVAAEAKLEEPQEISAPIHAHPISSIPWIICLRSGATELSKRRPLAVFYKDDEYVMARMSVIVDRCEGQAFTALKK